MSDSIIYSRLFKASYLVLNSSFFPYLVQAACAWHRVPFSEDVTKWCATRPEVLDAIETHENAAMDEILKDFATNPQAAEAMDNLILGAVEQYKNTNSPAQ